MAASRPPSAHALAAKVWRSRQPDVALAPAGSPARDRSHAHPPEACSAQSNEVRSRASASGTVHAGRHLLSASMSIRIRCGHVAVCPCDGHARARRDLSQNGLTRAQEVGRVHDRSIDRDVARQCRNAMRRPDALGLRRTHPRHLDCCIDVDGLLASPWRLPSGRQEAMGRRCATTRSLSRNSGGSPSRRRKRRAGTVLCSVNEAAVPVQP
jgi:hypothetical protein